MNGVCNNHRQKELTPCSRVLLEKLIIIQIFKKILIFMEHKGSLRCSQDLTTAPYPESN
jgi:hypothetical protein